jgi:hypothetical protein
MSFNKLVDHDNSLRDFISFMSQKFLYYAYFTIIVSLVTPGKTRSSRAGVTIYFLPVFGSLNTKNMFDVPTYPIFSLERYKTC